LVRREDIRKKLLFWKKVTKKLLLGGRPISVPIKANRRLGLIGTEASPPPGPKVFLVLFLQKKNRLLTPPGRF
jgi:hypothetical protein